MNRLRDTMIGNDFRTVTDLGVLLHADQCQAG